MTGQDIIKKFEAMGNTYRGNWEKQWQECSDWALPTNDNINTVRSPGTEKPPQRMIDSCIEANFNFASGMFSHMFPPNTIWAKFRHPDPSIMSNQAVADYFETVSRRVHQVLIGSNFAQEEFQSLLCIGAFGTNCISVEEDDTDIVRFRNFTVGKIRLAQNYLGKIDTCAREFKLDARQAIQQFGEEVFKSNNLMRVVNDAKDNKDTEYTFVHLVCPRTDYEKDKKDSLNKPFASYYVIKDGNNPIVKEGGFDYNPYTTGRFTVGNDEVYGRGPMSMVLATARRTNVIYRSAMLAAEQGSSKMLLVPNDDSIKMSRRRAIDLIKWDAHNPNGKPELLQPENPNLPLEMFEMHDSQIKRMFFNHLFRPLEDYRNMTAWEAQERSTTDMMVLSPFVSRYIDEHVSPMMNIVYYILQKKKMLPDPPEELGEDGNYNVDYVGRLALATKSFETVGAVNTLRIWGELSQLNPQMLEALDYVNNEKLFKELWYSGSSSMNALNDDKTVKDIKTARQQAQQRQQSIDNLAPVADAAQKLSKKVEPGSPLSELAG